MPVEEFDTWLAFYEFESKAKEKHLEEAKRKAGQSQGRRRSR